MPILRHDILPAPAELGIWEITEPESQFLESLLLYPDELRQLAGLKGRRRVEWLAARRLVHHMSGREKRAAFVKDEYGKPRLRGSDWHVSISHSHGLAAAVASPRLCGIDIQFIVPKITRLAHKFLRPEEAAAIRPEYELDQLHFYWGAKEALYKAYGRRRLDFREHIAIEPLAESAGKGATTGQVRKDGSVLDFRINYERSAAGYMLVWAVEQHQSDVK